MNILIPGTNTRVISGERENHRQDLAHIPTLGKPTFGFDLHRQAVASVQFQAVHIRDMHSNTMFIRDSKRRNEMPLNLENKIRLNKLSFVSHGTFPVVYNTLFCNEFPISWWLICSSWLRKRYVSKTGAYYQHLQIWTFVQTIENSL